MTNYSEFLIGIAELRVRMLCSFPYARALCSDFLCEGDADITVSVSQGEIDAERAQYAENRFSDGYCEAICLYRAIAERLPALGGFVFHGAAVDISGRGVIFAAPSGVGKSTHVSLLMKNFPDEVKMINGDKPIIRKTGGEWRVFSSPWAGKEGWKRNASAPLGAVVLLERAKENFIEEVSPEAFFDGIVRQVYLPVEAEGQILTFDMLDDMAGRVKFYRLGCDISDEAAGVSFNGLAIKK